MTLDEAYEAAETACEAYCTAHSRLNALEEVEDLLERAANTGVDSALVVRIDDVRLDVADALRVARDELAEAETAWYAACEVRDALEAESK